VGGLVAVREVYYVCNNQFDEFKWLGLAYEVMGNVQLSADMANAAMDLQDYMQQIGATGVAHIVVWPQPLVAGTNFNFPAANVVESLATVVGDSVSATLVFNATSSVYLAPSFAIDSMGMALALVSEPVWASYDAYLIADCMANTYGAALEFTGPVDGVRSPNGWAQGRAAQSGAVTGPPS
jgi:hypothetical protein